MSHHDKPRTKPKHLGPRDVTAIVSDDPAYMAVVDIGAYEKDLPDWDYSSLTRKLAHAASAGQVVAWGCPEQRLLSRGPCDDGLDTAEIERGWRAKTKLDPEPLDPRFNTSLAAPIQWEPRDSTREPPVRSGFKLPA